MPEASLTIIDLSVTDLSDSIARRAAVIEPRLSPSLDYKRENGDVLRDDPVFQLQEHACRALAAGDNATATHVIRAFEQSYFDLLKCKNAVPDIEKALFFVLERAVAANAEDVVMDGLAFAVRAEAYWASERQIKSQLAWRIAGVVLACVKAGMSYCAAYGIRGLSEIYANYVYFHVRRGEVQDQQQAEFALIGLPSILRSIIDGAVSARKKDVVDFAVSQVCLAIRDIARCGQPEMVTTTLRPWGTYLGFLVQTELSENLFDQYSENPFRADIWIQSEESAAILVDICGEAIKELGAGAGLPSGWIREYALFGQQLFAKRNAEVNGWPKVGPLVSHVAEQLGAIGSCAKSLDQEYSVQAAAEGLKTMFAVPAADERAVKDIRERIRKAMDFSKKPDD